MGVVEDLVRAREAYDRREWVAAYDGLSDPGTDVLAADDFARLATAAYLLGRHNDCIQALQRAYAADIAGGDVAGAARCCFWLAMVLFDGGEVAVAGGWVARAQRLLDDLADDVVERGYLMVLGMFQHIGAGEHETALAVAEQVESYGRRFADPDLTAQGQCARGRMLMYAGRVQEGLALLDEAMVAVSAGEVSPLFAGHIYCAMIEGCQEVSDFGRAAEWTTRLTRWCDDQQGLVPFTGQCAVHRGQIMRVRGAFSEALEEFELAQQRYVEAGSPPAAGLAQAERAEVLRLRGDYDAADAAYAAAIGFGHDPQPGLALLWLAQGRTAPALAAVRRLLGEPRDPVRRSQVLAAATEVLLADQALDEASAAADELARLAEQFASTALRAQAAYAAARGRAALDPARRAVRDGTGAGPARARAAGARRRGHRPGRAAGGPAHLRGGRGGAGRAARRGPARRPGRPRGPDRARGRGAAPGRGGQQQPRDRRRAGAQREDGGSPHEQHLHQAGRPDPDRGGRVRLRATPGLTRGNRTVIHPSVSHRRLRVRFVTCLPGRRVL
jgi:tetratricopeptide (TPR) repeat protein